MAGFELTILWLRVQYLNHSAISPSPTYIFVIQKLTSVSIFFLFSMGGAIAVHTAAKDLVPSLIGLCVIDVVEGNTVFVFSTWINTVDACLEITPAKN